MSHPSKIFYASGSKGLNVRADGNGGALARGWYVTSVKQGLFGPFKNVTAARNHPAAGSRPHEWLVNTRAYAEAIEPAPMVAQPVQQAQCNAAPVAAPGAPSEAIETAPQTVIRSAASIRAKLDPALVARFQWYRQNFPNSNARCELALARVHTKTRYPAEFKGWKTGRGMSSWFIENPADCGLRFVGYADEIVKLEHKGWFTSRDHQSDTMRGVVYQMPSRKGRAIFVPGYHYSNMDDGAALLDFTSLSLVTVKERGDFEDVRDLASDCAHGADAMAERAAETECDYQESWQAGSDYVEAGTEYREARKLYLGTMSAMRRSEYSAFRGDVTAKFLAEREELVSKRHKLFSAFGNTDAFREHLPE